MVCRTRRWEISHKTSTAERKGEYWKQNRYKTSFSKNNVVRKKNGPAALAV